MPRPCAVTRRHNIVQPPSPPLPFLYSPPPSPSFIESRYIPVDAPDGAFVLRLRDSKFVSALSNAQDERRLATGPIGITPPLPLYSLSAPRDISSLRSASSHSPWSNIRRRQRRCDPVRTQRKREKRWAEQELKWGRGVFVQGEHEEELRRSCFSALGHAYVGCPSSPAGASTPIPPHPSPSPLLSPSERHSVANFVIVGRQQRGSHAVNAALDDLGQLSQREQSAVLGFHHTIFPRPQPTNVKGKPAADPSAVLWDYVVGLFDCFGVVPLG